MSTARADIAQCIRHCAQARDGRGRWRAIDRCAVDLGERSFNARLCRATAEAAGRIGAWLAAQQLPAWPAINTSQDAHAG